MSVLEANDPARRWRLGGRELLLIVIFWTLLATLSSVNRLFDPRGFGLRVNYAGPVAMQFIESWIWAALTPFIFWLSSRFSLERSRWVTRIPMLLAIGVVVAIAVFFLLTVAREQIFDHARRRGGPMRTPLLEIARFRFVNQLVEFIAVLAAGYAREYFVRDQIRGREAAELERRAVTLQAQLADARLDALRMQLNPHFLFNTLHAISALVERDPAGVRKMIARLSELLRHTIDKDASNQVSLRDELAFLRRYIEIMEIRFQGRLRVSIDIDDEALDAIVPNLILQPIVENALEHGAARATGEGTIAIHAHRDGNSLVLRVQDNGPGVSDAARSGVGVANTRARLAELYGNDAMFSLTTAPAGGAVAVVELPFERR